jgi:Zn-dependent protease
MWLAEPPPSQGDLHFRLFGIPVRVHPMFWVITGLMGLDTRNGTPPAQFVIWMAVVFASILVHELGHAFLQRRFGGRPWITLQGLGGLASCDDCDRRPIPQILISLAGPAAGFALAALTAAVVRATGKDIGLTVGSDAPLPSGYLGFSFLGLTAYWELLPSRHANYLLFYLLEVNILWGLVNLLPVYPLDGGRVSREICMLRDPRSGLILSLQISLVAAAAMALYALTVWESFFTAAMFGYLAYASYQTLRAYQGSFR